MHSSNLIKLRDRIRLVITLYSVLGNKVDRLIHVKIAFSFRMIPVFGLI